MDRQSFENYLATLISENNSVDEAMNYALLGGGKRIRPLMLLSLLNDLGVDPQKGYDCASAIEMIHTYSLIHDDLPAMDNDDYRRGRLTVHKKFDEATAVLAGDGLLTRAFEVVSNSSSYSDHVKVRLLSILSECAGHNGMIRGQQLDMYYTDRSDTGYDDLYQIDIYKTGQLLACPLLCAAVIAGREELLNVLKEDGLKIGVAFQIQDDVLDYVSSADKLGKSTSDAANNKSTYFTLLGEKKAVELYERLYDEVINTIADYQTLKALISKVRDRDY
ncbi:MAG: polyprenyl synthetase family protein [Erysipelotrichaceae bacterium]|nr:polyprenyl synthetase family protein [Erysipelotrichaceae bacterium]